MKSYFITGTDTNVGKTYITAGLAAACCKYGINVGVMKPFAAGNPKQNGFKSEDVEILAQAAQVNDPEELLNPQFFPIFASPYTATQNLGSRIDLPLVVSCFKKLLKLHDTLLVEGIGGIMTPIQQDYFVRDLIKEMNLETIIVTRTRIGTINHTLLTHNICKENGIKIRGIIINDLDSDGYSTLDLKRDLEKLLDTTVLAIIPKISPFDIKLLEKLILQQIDVKKLFSY
jgi:dethiobiotin synthetase